MRTSRCDPREHIWIKMRCQMCRSGMQAACRHKHSRGSRDCHSVFRGRFHIARLVSVVSVGYRGHCRAWQCGMGRYYRLRIAGIGPFLSLPACMHARMCLCAALEASRNQHWHAACAPVRSRHAPQGKHHAWAAAPAQTHGSVPACTYKYMWGLCPKTVLRV